MKKMTFIGASLLILVASTTHAEASTVSKQSIFDLFSLDTLKEKIVALRHGDKRPPPTRHSALRHGDKRPPPVAD